MTKKGLTKGELCNMLVDRANEYRSNGILKSLKRNNHMNNFSDKKLKQSTADAILVDFINYVAACQGMDLGLYTKHLENYIE